MINIVIKISYSCLSQLHENVDFNHTSDFTLVTIQIVFLHIYLICTLLNNFCFLLICCKCFISVLKRFPKLSRHLQRIRSRHSVRSTEGYLGNEGVSRGCTKILSAHQIHKANVIEERSRYVTLIISAYLENTFTQLQVLYSQCFIRKFQLCRLLIKSQLYKNVIIFSQLNLFS